ncbi:MAG: hypothetical protein QN229_03585 [Desulfurococcaceae archaeon TW002]
MVIPSCEEAEIKIVGKSVFIKLKSGATAFIPIDQVCLALEKFKICLPKDSRIKCS